MDNFNLKEKIVIITGGAGLLGEKHAEAVAEIGGIPIKQNEDCQQIALKVADIMEIIGLFKNKRVT